MVPTVCVAVCERVPHALRNDIAVAVGVITDALHAKHEVRARRDAFIFID